MSRARGTYRQIHTQKQEKAPQVANPRGWDVSD
jgi:hypothetical protein